MSPIPISIFLPPRICEFDSTKLILFYRITTPSPARRTPGRPRKSTTNGKRGRPSKNKSQPEDTYQPDEQETVEEGDEETEEDWESAALVWGCISVGGLGFGGAGVYGAEVGRI